MVPKLNMAHQSIIKNKSNRYSYVEALTMSNITHGPLAFVKNIWKGMNFSIYDKIKLVVGLNHIKMKEKNKNFMPSYKPLKRCLILLNNARAPCNHAQGQLGSRGVYVKSSIMDERNSNKRTPPYKIEGRFIPNLTPLNYFMVFDLILGATLS